MSSLAAFLIPRDPDHPVVRREEIVVRDVAEPDIGIGAVDFEAPVHTDGLGYLCAEAHREVEERLDLEEYVGEHVATVWVDAEARVYWIEWEVEVPLTQRLFRALRRGGDGADA